MDSLLTVLVFVVLSVLASMLKRKGTADESPDDWSEESETPPLAPPRRTTTPQPTPPRQPKPTGWEEELRRLLEGEEPTAPPPTAPPIVVFEPPRPKPPPLPVAPPPVLAPQRVVKQVAVVADEAQASTARLAPMTQAAQVYRKASQLDASVAARMEQVTQQRVAMTSVIGRKARTAEAEQIVSLFRNPRTARQAVIASVIFGPSNAFKEPAGF